MIRSRSFILISLIFMHIWCAASYGPSLFFHKPYNPEPFLNTLYASFCTGRTSEGYNRHGATVPFLQEYGQEDLLRRFIDGTVPKDDTQVIGSIKFAGNLDFQRLNLLYTKNIFHHCFMGMVSIIQNLQVNNIRPTITLTHPLNPEQQHALEILESKIPISLNTSGILTTALEFGYNRVFDNFSSIRFLHFFIKGNIATPQWLQGHNLSILQYPLSGNMSFAYPVTCIVNLGIHKHINFGLFNEIIPFQPRQLNAPLNNTTSHNDILLDHVSRIIAYPGAVFSSAFYIEVHNFVPNFMISGGYGSASGMPWKIHAFDQTHFNDSLINRNELLNGWNISSIFLQIDYNFTSEKHPIGPAISLYYVYPLAGRYFPKIAILGGSFNFGITQEF